MFRITVKINKWTHWSLNLLSIWAHIQKLSGVFIYHLYEHTLRNSLEFSLPWDRLLTRVFCFSFRSLSRDLCNTCRSWFRLFSSNCRSWSLLLSSTSFSFDAWTSLLGPKWYKYSPINNYYCLNEIFRRVYLEINISINCLVFIIKFNVQLRCIRNFSYFLNNARFPTIETFFTVLYNSDKLIKIIDIVKLYYLKLDGTI